MRRSRVRTPTVLQMEAVECGAAALAIVLGYYGRHVPLEEMRVACGVSRNGSNALNIVRAARAYGLNASGLSRKPESLRSLKLPFVVHWRFGHFLVVEGFGRGKVYVNDPAEGHRTIPDAQFDRDFTGVVLAFEPGDDFKKGGARQRFWPAVRRRVASSSPALAYAILAGLFLVVPGLIVPTFLRLFVDDVLVGGSTALVMPLVIGVLAAAGIRAALTWLQSRALRRLEARLALNGSSQFLWHLLHLPMAFYSQRYAGEVGSRVAISDRVASLLSGDLATTAINLVLAVFYAALMLQYSVWLTLLSVALVAANLLAMRVLERRRSDAVHRVLQDQGKFVGVTMSGLQMIETYKSTGSEDDFFGRWAGLQANAMASQQHLGVTSALLAIIPEFLSALNTIAILGVGSLLVIDGEMTLGMLIAFQSLNTSFGQPTRQLLGLNKQVEELGAGMNRLDDVLRHPIESSFHALPGPGEAGDGIGALGKLTGALELRNVTFGYGRLDPPLIENFSLALKPGDRVALVGGTGSGKSTIARLLAGLYEPWSGEILFDGAPRHVIPPHVLASSVAAVDQEIHLFEGTVRENVNLWDATIPEEDIVRAATEAAIHDEIVVRLGGYNSLVEEEGRNFSGGQRQRLEIARALARDPRLLILDEATSALDSITEQRIDDSLRRRGCTCLIIAHRLSTIRDCDEIIVLDNGHVAERGTHAQMIKRNGPYARLIRAEGLEQEEDKLSSLLDGLL